MYREISRISSRRLAIEFEDTAHHRCGDRHAAGATAENRRHRRQKHRRAFSRRARLGETEIVHPGDLGVEPHDLAQRQEDAEDKHRDNQAIESRIGHERNFDLLAQQKHDHPAEQDEHHHPQQEEVR